jgi:hypothetical protein
LMCMQAWSRADMLGDQSCFMNALMTYLDDEEEKVTSFTLFYYHYSFFLFVSTVCHQIFRIGTKGTQVDKINLR